MSRNIGYTWREKYMDREILSLSLSLSQIKEISLCFSPSSTSWQYEPLYVIHLKISDRYVKDWTNGEIKLEALIAPHAWFFCNNEEKFLASI